jgi:hypothetical protein
MMERLQETGFLTIDPSRERIDPKAIRVKARLRSFSAKQSDGPNTVTNLPLSLAPRGLSRVQAAEYISVGVTTFDEMADGRMPVGGGFTR